MGQTKDKGRKGHRCKESLRTRHLGMVTFRPSPRRHGTQNMSSGTVILRGPAGALLGWEHREEGQLAPSPEISIISVTFAYYAPPATTKKSGGVGRCGMSEGEKGVSLNLEEASQQGNGMVSHALHPTRTSYKGFWVDGVLSGDLAGEGWVEGSPQRGPGGGRLGNSHMNGFTVLWICLCCLRPEDVAKVLPQSGQA